VREINRNSQTGI